MIRNLIAIITVVLLLPYGTAAASFLDLSYSGRLNALSGKPVVGPVDLRIKFYTAAEGGSAIGPTLNLPAVPLVQGMFQVPLALSAGDVDILFGDGTATAYVEVTDVTNDRTYPRQGFLPVPLALRVPVDGTTLKFDGQGKLYVDETQLTVTGADANALSGADVSTTLPTTVGQVLKWDGSKWGPGTDATVGGGSITDGINLGAGGAGTADIFASAVAPDLRFRRLKSGTGITLAQTADEVEIQSHVPVTLGTANGLGLTGQQLTLGLASTSTTGALSSADWNTFNNKVTYPAGDAAKVGHLAVTQAVDLDAMETASHAAVTLGTANGLGLTGQQLTLGLASTSTTGALSNTDWNTFNNKVSYPAGDATKVGHLSVTQAVNLDAIETASHAAVTLGTANGLGLTGQQLTLGLSSTSTTGALSNTDWNTFNNKVSYPAGDATKVGHLAVTQAVDLDAIETASHAAVTIGTANGLSLSGQQVSMGLASTSTTGALSSTDWNTFNSAASVGPGLVQGRLTFVSGDPIPSAFTYAATTVYFTPFRGNRIALYNGSAWVIRTFTQRSLALTMTSGKNYDVFAYDNAGTVTLELSSAWTTDTARADAVTWFQGVYTKAADPTRLYLGTLRASAANQSEDSDAKRFLWNYYNRVTKRAMKSDAVPHSYNTAAWRQYGAVAANKIEFVRGFDEDLIHAVLTIGGASTGGASCAGTQIGIDNTSPVAVMGGFDDFEVAGIGSQSTAVYVYGATLGYHGMLMLQSGCSNPATWSSAVLVATYPM